MMSSNDTEQLGNVLSESKDIEYYALIIIYTFVDNYFVVVINHLSVAMM